MDLRFTLSHTLDTRSSVDELNTFINQGSGVDWTTGVTPQVTLTNLVGSSKNLVGELGNAYTGAYEVVVDLDTVLNSGTATANFFTVLLMDASFNTIDSDVISNSTLGNQVLTFNLTAVAEAPLYVAIQISNSVSPASNKTYSINSIDVNSGSVATTSQEISEPDGWKGGKIRLERDSEFGSLIENYKGSAGGAFVFYGENDEVNGGISYIKQLEQDYGFDVNISILAEFAPDDVNYLQIFEGLLDVSAKNEMKDNLMQVPIIRDDFWTKFMNRKETPVNLSDNIDLDGNVVAAVESVIVDLPSQPIRKVHYSIETDQGSVIATTLEDEYGQFTPGKFELDEMDHFYSLVPINQTEVPAPSFDVLEEGVYTFDIRWTISVILGATENHVNSASVYIQFNEETPILFSESDQTTGGVDYTYFTHSSERYLLVGDTVRIYLQRYDPAGSGTLQYGFWGTNGLQNGPLDAPTYDQPRPSGMAEIPTYTRVTADTVVAATQAEAYLVHDLIHGVLARMGIGDNPFYSEFLGATFTNTAQYDANGCGCGYVIIKGLQLRGYTLSEKPFFISFQQIWDGLNPILNLGLSYEIIDDSPNRQVIRIEQKAHFFQDDVSVNFSNVREISCSYDQDFIFKRMKVGYKSWQADDISGNDDYAKQTRATRFEKAGREINLESDFIASGIAIETTKRTSRVKSADFKYDNNNFIIAINTDDVSPDRYYPELDENFTSITGMLHSNNRYNLVISPLYNFFRWANVFGGCLQSYTTSFYKFVSGEGNYDFTTQHSCVGSSECQAIICDSVTQRQHISLAEYNDDFGYLFLPILHDITIPMEWEEYETINENRKKSIGISQSEAGFIPFKIKLLEYDFVRGEANIKAWPKTSFNIQVIEQETTMDCETVGGVISTNRRLLEDGSFRLLESSDFRLLE